VQSFRRAVRGVDYPTGTAPCATPDVVSRPCCFLEGFLSNVLNPKVAVFYLAFLPQFIGPTDSVLHKSLLLTGIHYIEGMLWLVAVSIAVDRTRRFFLQSIVHRWLDGVCGALLVGFGVRLALARQ
jgi:threonine/homoserine/homoserine lactone efflux protein